MSNSVDLDETAHLDLCCLQKPIIIACGSERVKRPMFAISKTRDSLELQYSNDSYTDDSKIDGSFTTHHENMPI